MQNLNLNQSVVVVEGDSTDGFKTTLSTHEGSTVMRNGYWIEQADEPGLPVVKVGSPFMVEGQWFMVWGFSEDNGWPEFGAAPRSMVG